MSQSARVPESLGLSRRESSQRGRGQVGFVQGIRYQGVPHRPGVHPRGPQPRGRGDDDDAGGAPVLKSLSMKGSHLVMSGEGVIPYARSRTPLPGLLVPTSFARKSVVNPTIPLARLRRLASRDDASPPPHFSEPVHPAPAARLRPSHRQKSAGSLKCLRRRLHRRKTPS